MDYEALETAWRSATNNPSAAASAYVIGQAQAALTRRRAHLRRVLAFAAAGLTGLAALTGYDLVANRGAGLDLTRQWALLPLLLIPVVALIAVVRRHAARAAPPGALLETFRALRDDNASARARIVLIGGAVVAFAPLLAVGLTQFIASGRMAPDEAASAAVVLGGALAASLAWMGAKYALRLVPERRHLDALIAQYETN